MRIPRLFGLCAIVCAVGMLVLAVLILRPVMIANSIRNELRTFQAGSFSSEQLANWAAKHGGSTTCDGGRCEASVSVSNRPLNLLRLAPLTYFDASIVTNNGQLAQTSLRISDLRYATRPSGSTTQLLVKFAGTAEGGQSAPLERVAQEPIGKAPAIVYVASSKSDPHARALAYDMNVWCLARVGGCTGSQQAPTVWALRK
jgi:hypothetical protein